MEFRGRRQFLTPNFLIKLIRSDNNIMADVLNFIFKGFQKSSKNRIENPQNRFITCIRET